MFRARLRSAARRPCDASLPSPARVTSFARSCDNRPQKPNDPPEVSSPRIISVAVFVERVACRAAGRLSVTRRSVAGAEKSATSEVCVRTTLRSSILAGFSGKIAGGGCAARGSRQDGESLPPECAMLAVHAALSFRLRVAFWQRAQGTFVLLTLRVRFSPPPQPHAEREEYIPICRGIRGELEDGSRQVRRRPLAPGEYTGGRSRYALFPRGAWERGVKNCRLPNKRLSSTCQFPIFNCHSSICILFLLFEHFCQEPRRHRAGGAGDHFRRAFGHDLAAFVGRAGAEVDDVIGGLHHL